MEQIKKNRKPVKCKRLRLTKEEQEQLFLDFISNWSTMTSLALKYKISPNYASSIITKNLLLNCKNIK